MSGLGTFVISILSVVCCGDVRMPTTEEVDCLNVKISSFIDWSSHKDLNESSPRVEPRRVHAYVDRVGPNLVTLSGGTDDGLRPGDWLLVNREEQDVAIVSVISASRDSAEAKVVKGSPKVGDLIDALVPSVPGGEVDNRCGFNGHRRACRRINQRRIAVLGQ